MRIEAKQTYIPDGHAYSKIVSLGNVAYELCLLFIYYNSSYFACNSTDKSSNANNNYFNNNSKICRLAFNGTPGSPVIFPARYYDELMNLPQGKGGGFIAKKYPAQVVLVPAQDEYELYDIDTPDDLIRLSRYLR